jgi:ABC-type multidrug transport system ATPase subunit
MLEPAASAPFVDARGVTKRYRSGTVANDGLTFSADLGEVVALLGPNGAGKTTFVLQLVGLLAPTSGSILVGGIDVVRRPADVKRLVGYQPQGHNAMGGLEVRHVLECTARLRGLPSAEARRQARALAAEFGLEEILGKRLNTLSGGWRRLTDVAVAFAGAPSLVVLDEPTDNLDPAHRRLVWQKLDGLRASRHATCLVATHNLLEAERAVDRVVVVNQGRVTAAGSPGALKRRFGKRVLLEVRLREHENAAAVRAALAALGRTETARPGELRTLIPPERVAEAVALLTAPDAAAWLEDFSLGPPSLEAVYFELQRGVEHAVLAA